jgi:hypothetical protein
MRYGWDGSLSRVFDSLRAFSWQEGSRDAAQLVTLAPGQYTTISAEKGGGGGWALIEVYDAPGQ